MMSQMSQLNQVGRAVILLTKRHQGAFRVDKRSLKIANTFPIGHPLGHKNSSITLPDISPPKYVNCAYPCGRNVTSTFSQRVPMTPSREKFHQYKFGLLYSNNLSDPALKLFNLHTSVMENQPGLEGFRDSRSLRMLREHVKLNIRGMSELKIVNLLASLSKTRSSHSNFVNDIRNYKGKLKAEEFSFGDVIKIHEPKSKNGCRSVKSFLSVLSILGLFKGMTIDEIEAEENRLADEQKVKKMKPVELLIAKGVLSMCDQEYAKANELFHKALRITQDENDEDKETLVLNLLASNFFESGDLENAEKLFIDLIKRMIAKGVEPTDPAILELSLKLASIYSRNDITHGKAMKGFKFVINSLLTNLEGMLNEVEHLEIYEISDDKKDELALLGWSYDWFAKHLIAINDYTGAADMLQKALQISSKVLGPLHDQTLILLNDVGTTLAMNNAPEKGRTFLKRAVEGAIESQSKELASFYVNLGLVNLKLRRLSEAKRYCENSIELALKNREHHNSNEVITLSKSCLSEIQRLLEVENQ